MTVKKAKVAKKAPSAKKIEVPEKKLEIEKVQEAPTPLETENTPETDTKQPSTETPEPTPAPAASVPEEKLETVTLPPENTSAPVVAAETTTNPPTPETQSAPQIEPQKEQVTETQPESEKEPATQLQPSTLVGDQSSPTVTQNPAPTLSSPLMDVKPESVFQTGQDIPTKRPSKLPFILLLLCIVALFAAGGYFTLSKHLVTLPKNLTIPFITTSKPTPTPEPVATATPTPEKVNLSEFTITVLNGSGVTGAASKAKTYLTSQGFTVDATGNASSSTFTQTTVDAKSSVSPDFLAKLVQTLGVNYVVSSTNGKLDSSSSTDVVVTIGKTTK